MKTVFITGVSTGIGAASSRSFLSRGYRVIGTVRRFADADPLAKLGAERFTPVILDVEKRDEIAKLGSQLKQMLGPEGLDGFVNNAGIATVGGVIDQPYDDLVKQFHVNVFAPVLILRELFPFLKMAQGRIIQVGSVAGELTFPFMSAYAGSKHAMEAQSDALRRELGFVGISVVHLQFGSVKTPIWGKLDSETQSAMDRSLWKEAFGRFAQGMAAQGEAGIDPDEAGRRLVAIFETPNPKTRYAILRNRFGRWVVPRLLPDKVLDRGIGKLLGLIKSAR